MTLWQHLAYSLGGGLLIILITMALLIAGVPRLLVIAVEKGMFCMLWVSLAILDLTQHELPGAIIWAGLAGWAGWEAWTAWRNWRPPRQRRRVHAKVPSFPVS